MVLPPKAVGFYRSKAARVTSVDARWALPPKAVGFRAWTLGKCRRRPPFSAEKKEGKSRSCGEL
ncbi:MAG: hypothetical protein RR540_08490, partial [Oscillospiraceae bacterium]